MCVRNLWWVWKDSNLQCSKELRVYGPVGQPVAPTHPHLAERTRVERASPEGTARFKRDRLATCRTSPKLMAVAARVERASPEGTSRLERDGLSKCPTLPSTPATKTCRRGPRSVAVGAGLEPAHASRREPRLRRGAIPFRSSYRYRQSGGDDPIRTDGALRRHSALAVRCLRPLGHVSLKPLVGMERFELSRAKALVSKTSVSPISTTSPQLSNFTNLDTHRVIEFISANSSANGGLPGTRTLKMSQLLRLPRLPIPPEAHKVKAPRFFEGLWRYLELCLNQPHPSVHSKSLRLSDRYDWNRFFTEMSIPHSQAFCN